MPTIEPVSVIWLVPARAIPKSVTLTRPSPSTRTLCGLMSRCTIPCRCAKRSAERIWRAYSTATLTGAAPRPTIELLERAPVEVLHRDVVRVLGLAAVVDRDDVRMVQRGGVLRLAPEPLDELVVVRVAAR